MCRRSSTFPIDSSGLTPTSVTDERNRRGVGSVTNDRAVLDTACDPSEVPAVSGKGIP